MRSMVEGASPLRGYPISNGRGGDAPSVTALARRATSPASQGRR